MRRTLRTKVMLLALVVLAAGLAMPQQPPAEIDPMFALTPHGQVLEWEQGQGLGTFGPNQPVSIALGQMARVEDCDASELVEGDPLDPTDDRPEFTPTDDFLFPFTNVYIVPTKLPGGDRELTDVTTTPAVAVGLSGGLFSDTISFTKPEGVLGKGRYAIVYDECQDNLLDENDAIFSPAFEVVIPANVPPLDGSAVRKAKARAKVMAIHFAIIKVSAEYWKKMNEIREVIDCLSGGLSGCIASMITDKIEDRLKEEIGAGLGIPELPDPAEIAYNIVNALFGHYANLGADPPNLDFERPAALGSIERLVPRDADPLEPSLVGLGNAAAVESSLTASLLDAVEMYQGAGAEHDGDHALIHAREIAARADALADNLAGTDDALSGFRTALGANAPDLEAIAAEIAPFEQRVTSQGFTADEARTMRNLGMSPAQIEDIRLAIVDVPSDAGSVDATQQAIDDLLADRPGAVTELRELADSMEPIIDALLADPGVDDLTPRADAGGPYAGTRGAPVQLDASGSSSPDDTIVSYAWDLDADGAFDDATGSTPSFMPAGAFAGFVGLEVVDDADRRSIGYAAITITDPNRAPAVTARAPAPRSATVTSGASQTFSVSVSDPDGDAVTVRWTADGVTAHTGPTFAYTPDTAGMHLLEAHITDAAHETLARWHVTSEAPDADGDLWRANVDCDDANGARFPGNPDVVNGIDDDCDAGTPDGGIPPVVDAGADQTASEGRFVLTGATFTDAAPSGAFTAQIDWGDGATSAGSIRPGRAVVGEHDFAQDGIRLVRVCVTGPPGATGCDTTTVTVGNDAPAARLPRLDGWIAEEILDNPSPGFWSVSEDAQSVLVTQNHPGQVLLSPFAFGYGTGRVTMEQIEDNSDGDQFGLAFGVQPGESQDPNAEFYVVDWGRDTAGANACGRSVTQEPGIALTRHTGADFHSFEFFTHDDLPCSAGVVEGLARGIAHPTQAWERARPYVWTFDYQPDRLRVWIDDVLEIDQAGTFPPGRFGLYNSSQSDTRYSDIEPAQGTIGAEEGRPSVIPMTFVDAGTEDDLFGTFTFGDGSGGGGDIERLGPSGVLRVPHVFEDEGTTSLHACASDGQAEGCVDTQVVISNVAPVVYAGPDTNVNAHYELAPASFTDPGVLDTHTATVNWGDGSPSQPLAIDAGVMRSSHDYLADGTYTVEVCVTDNDAGVGCDQAEITAAVTARPAAVTVEPVVGREGVDVTLPVAWRDPNADDEHIVTVDWGDGSPVQTVTAAMTAHGAGVAYPVHRYGDNGVFSALVTVCDHVTVCPSATATATIANVAPVVVRDVVVVTEDVETVIDVLANDVDVPADPLRLTITSQRCLCFGEPPGTVLRVQDDKIVFRTAPDFTFGWDVTYSASDGDGGAAFGQLRIEIEPVNDAPAPVDDVATLDEDGAGVTISVTNNDRDVDSTMRILGVTQPSDATVTQLNNQQLRYTPAPNACGAAEPFTYEVQDFEGLTATATVRVTITCVNDAPVGVDETVATDRYASVTGDALANDTDAELDVLSVTLIQAPSAGTLDLAPNGAFTYVPDPTRFADRDRFVYEVCDGNGACDVASTFIDEISCEEGLAVLDGTVADGTASYVIGEEVERRVAEVDPDHARTLRDVNCGVVAPLEKDVNEVRLP